MRINGVKYKWSFSKLVCNMMYLIGTLYMIWNILSVTVLTGDLVKYNMWYYILEMGGKI